MPTTLPNNQPGVSERGSTAAPVVNGHQRPAGAPGPIKRRRSGWKIFGAVVLLLCLGVFGVAIGKVLKIFRPNAHETNNHAGGFIQEMKGIIGVVTNPQSGFPGMSKVVICCMGIDDNWTNADEVYTQGARTDTLFLLTLDLKAKKVTMLSIPRDTYVPIAGTKYSGKINSAFSTGGPARTEATISQWLGVQPNYYMVLNIDATKRLVNALGGVDVNVEHAMDYDDDWGHLHVHLKPGEQHLDGDAAVGFARYRHGNHGITPEDGDERRMYRQHVLMQAMMQQAKSPSNLLHIDDLIDTGMECVRTDLDRTQLADLASIFRGSDPNTDVITASLSGQDGRGAHGEYVMLIDQNQARQYADWLVGGDQAVGRALTPVHVANGTSITGLATKAITALHSLGYQNCSLSSATSGAALTRTTILDRGVANRDAAHDIAQLLGVPDASIARKAAEPNKLGWTPTPDIEVTLGSDYARSPST